MCRSGVVGGGRLRRATPRTAKLLTHLGDGHGVDADTRAAIDAFKTAVAERYGDRLDRVVLYGSHARNEATDGSDVDLMLVLDGEVQPGQEIDALADLIWEILVEHGVLLSVFPVSSEDYETRQSPLLINARRDGVPA